MRNQLPASSPPAPSALRTQEWGAPSPLLPEASLPLPSPILWLFFPQVFCRHHHPPRPPSLPPRTPLDSPWLPPVSSFLPHLHLPSCPLPGSCGPLAGRCPPPQLQEAAEWDGGGRSRTHEGGPCCPVGSALLQTVKISLCLPPPQSSGPGFAQRHSNFPLFSARILPQLVPSPSPGLLPLLFSGTRLPVSRPQPAGRSFPPPLPEPVEPRSPGPLLYPDP